VSSGHFGSHFGTGAEVSWYRSVLGPKCLGSEVSGYPLEGRRIRADLIEVFKMINGQTNVKFKVFFEFDTNYRTRGHARKLKKNRFNRDLRQHFVTEQVINVWNKLDNQTVLASSLNNFKWNLDRLRRSRMMGLLLD